MKPSMQLHLGQQLTLTPQLQQAIRLLQLSSIELQQEIQNQLENNPLLELEEIENNAKQLLEGNDISLSSDMALNENTLPKELPMDHQWDDIYPNNTSSTKSLNHEDNTNFENVYSTKLSLKEHLLWQLALTPFSETDQAIAEIIIDSINLEGFLELDTEELLAIVNQDRAGENLIEKEEVEVVLHRIQHFDPIGVGARNLGECLLLQLSQFSDESPTLTIAKKIIHEHAKALSEKEYKLILSQLKINKDLLIEALELIRTLHPKPGLLIANPEPDYIIPDVIVNKVNGVWQANLNQNHIPKLGINQHYSNLISKDKKDNVFIKNNLQEAKWFIKSLQSRHDTLLRVAKCIIEYQVDFLEHGEEAMKPLVLHDIAEALELHESTISRVTTQKYMHTPRGIFELKYFFSSQVSTESGGNCSSTAIRAVIRKLIANENSAKPLSDNKIALLLKEKGINVARRTIAKYRESMGIPSSNERKYLSLDSL